MQGLLVVLLLGMLHSLAPDMESLQREGWWGSGSGHLQREGGSRARAKCHQPSCAGARPRAEGGTRAKAVKAPGGGTGRGATSRMWLFFVQASLSTAVPKPAAS